MTTAICIFIIYPAVTALFTVLNIYLLTTIFKEKEGE